MKYLPRKRGLDRMIFSRKNSGGFTIIELMVTIAIYAFISTVVIANYRDYSKNAVSANSSEDIILALRQAQVYGASGRGCAAASPFDCRYGVFFLPAPGFTIFIDNNDNKVYDLPADTAIETIIWKDSSVITKVECLNYAKIDAPCAGGVLNVSFKRPSPDSIINDISDMTGQTAGGYQFGRITVWNGVTGAGAKYSTTTISQAGQISHQ